MSPNARDARIAGVVAAWMRRWRAHYWEPVRKWLPRLSIVSVFRTVLFWISFHSAIRKDIRKLQNLDDRMLRDIGIDRGEIEHSVRFGRKAG
jgi:uncharacterized protein YjiS (DUF1127 family)